MTPLVFSPSTFYGETDYAQYLKDGTFDFNIGLDTTRGPLPLAASFSNDRTSSRIVVIGDREFATNGYGLRTSPPNSAAFVYPEQCTLFAQRSDLAARQGIGCGRIPDRRANGNRDYYPFADADQHADAFANVPL